MSFSSDLKGFTVKVQANSEKVFRGTSISLFRNIVRRTPVKTGVLRGNWQTDINRPSSGTLERSGSAAANSEIVRVAGKAKLDETIFFVNNLPYSVPIEKGSSTQAPAGMVAVTVSEFQREVNKQARKLK